MVWGLVFLCKEKLFFSRFKFCISTQSTVFTYFTRIFFFRSFFNSLARCDFFLLFLFTKKKSICFTRHLEVFTVFMYSVKMKSNRRLFILFFFCYYLLWFASPLPRSSFGWLLILVFLFPWHFVCITSGINSLSNH